MIYGLLAQLMQNDTARKLLRRPVAFFMYGRGVLGTLISLYLSEKADDGPLTSKKSGRLQISSVKTVYYEERYRLELTIDGTHTFCISRGRTTGNRTRSKLLIFHKDDDFYEEHFGGVSGKAALLYGLIHYDFTEKAYSDEEWKKRARERNLSKAMERK